MFLSSEDRSSSILSTAFDYILCQEIAYNSQLLFDVRLLKTFATYIDINMSIFHFCYFKFNTAASALSAFSSAKSVQLTLQLINRFSNKFHLHPRVNNNISHNYIIMQQECLQQSRLSPRVSKLKFHHNHENLIIHLKH